MSVERRERRGARSWLTVERTFVGSLLLPRPFLYLDGDLDGRALIGVGVSIGTKWSDPPLSFGVDFHANPGSPGWRLAEALDRLLGPKRHGTWRPLG